MKITPWKTKGFTLIEMLVVIGIIGVLMAISVAGVESVRMRSRDARRKTDLDKVQGGLATYYADRKVYPLPVPLDAADSSFPGYFNGTVGGYAEMLQNAAGEGLVKDGYLDAVYQDPKSKYRYRVSNDGLGFEISAALENSHDNDATSDNPSNMAGSDSLRYEVGNKKTLDTSVTSYDWTYDFDAVPDTHKCVAGAACKTE